MSGIQLLLAFGMSFAFGLIVTRILIQYWFGR